jgi:hypothetical protein
VISTVSPMVTFSALIDAEFVPAAMRRKLRHARLSHRAVSLQFGMSNPIHTRSHLTTVLPPMQRQGEIFTQEVQNGNVGHVFCADGHHARVGLDESRNR